MFISWQYVESRHVSPMKANLYIPVFLFSGLLTSSSFADQMTLGEAVAKAVQGDPTIRKVYADVSEAQGYANETRADLRPQLALEARGGAAYRDRSIDGVSSGGDTLFSRSVNLIGRQLLTDFGYSWWRWQDAKERVKAKDLLEKEQREISAMFATEAFLSVMRDRKQIEIAKRNLGVHEKVSGLATERGKAAGNQADIELSSARQNLAKTLVRERELALRQSEANFIRWVGQKPPSVLVAPKYRSFSSLDEIDPQQSFHYQAVTHQLVAAGLIKKSLQRKYAPRVFLEVGGQLGQDVLGIEGKDNAASAMIVVSWDIFDGGRKKAEIEQAMADIDRQKAILDETLVTLRQDMNARWADYRTLSERISIVKQYTGELQKTVDLYQEQFDLGTRPLLSLLDIQNEVSSADIRLADYEKDHILLGYRLLFFGGQLIRETAGEQYLHTATSESLAQASGYEKNPVMPPAPAPVSNVRTVDVAPDSATEPEKKPSLARRLFRR